ncbi:uncharacterized protein LOC115919993 [Strongylocentrotus purpuratus]|uniref:Uncharacterized protein n=1 Tax=Strongylocentrotus purpuratus TaxID=7668 RepID=A0A7M7N672_STRPU|nr:uncharacterized protein LOC115919993 [Strongylocentrotus purpuratus]
MVLGFFICKKERTFSSSENECEGRGKSAEINRRATLAATEVGLARDSLCDLLTILGTAPLVEAPSYNRHIATLSSLSQETSKDQKKKGHGQGSDHRGKSLCGRGSALPWNMA